MATNHTTNYQLNQWEATDQVLRTDFNEDNAKIDAALAGLAVRDMELEAAIAQKGNCQLVYGTYTGTGNSGQSNPCMLNFSGKPLVVIIFSQGDFLLMGRPCVNGFWACSDGFREANVTWSENEVSWYHSYTNEQMNVSGTTYSYVALMQIGA